MTRPMLPGTTARATMAGGFGTKGERLVHFEGPGGTLCRWDGGRVSDDRDGDVCDCPDCWETLRYLWRLWHPRTPAPRPGGGP